MSDLIRVTDHGDTLQAGPFTLRTTGLEVTGTPTLEEWQTCGKVLRRMEGAVQFWIGDWVNYGARAYGEKYTAAVAATGLAEETLWDYAYVAAHVETSLRNEVVPYTAHKVVAPLPAADQARWLTRAADEELSAAELRRQIRLGQRAATTNSEVLPEGPFRVLYADPPWQYGNSGVINNGDAYGRAERHYPTMAIEELCALEVRDIVADDAVLFLWVTSPLLRECWAVIDAWGFTYKTSMVWDKVAHNYGHYVSVRHELLLICTRGSCLPDAPTPMPDSVISVPRSEVHSEKPAVVRQVIERLYPFGARLELFGRQAVAGWTVYGNQLRPRGAREGEGEA